MTDGVSFRVFFMWCNLCFGQNWNWSIIELLLLLILVMHKHHWGYYQTIRLMIWYWILLYCFDKSSAKFSNIGSFQVCEDCIFVWGEWQISICAKNSFSCADLIFVKLIRALEIMSSNETNGRRSNLRKRESVSSMKTMSKKNSTVTQPHTPSLLSLVTLPSGGKCKKNEILVDGMMFLNTQLFESRFFSRRTKS